MKTEDLRWTCSDDVTLAVSLFQPAVPRAVLVVAAAMGVPRQYYRRFAQDLAGRGVAVVTFDYRGIAGSGAEADPMAMRLEDWGRLDVEAALQHAQRRFPGLPLFLVGHSCGGQVAGLAPASERLAGLIFTAASVAWRGHWPSPLARAFMAIWCGFVIPLASRGRWFPARRLRFSTLDIPGGAMRQWAEWATSRRHLFTPELGIDTERYRRLACPGLVISFSDDFYAPQAAVRGLTQEYPQVPWDERHYKPADLGQRAIGHLGFYREALRDTLWGDVAQWILDVAARHERAVA